VEYIPFSPLGFFTNAAYLQSDGSVHRGVCRQLTEPSCHSTEEGVPLLRRELGGDSLKSVQLEIR
jgi:hypothetical protein